MQALGNCSLRQLDHAIWLSGIQHTFEMNSQYPLMRVRLGLGIEPESADLEIQTTARQSEGPGALGNVAARPVQRGLNQVALDLLDRQCEVGCGPRRPGSAGGRREACRGDFGREMRRLDRPAAGAQRARTPDFVLALPHFAG